MRSYTVFDGSASLETLDLRLSLTALSLAAHAPAPVVSGFSCDDDPLPEPQPNPGTTPGTLPPPTSGPMAPGSL